MANEFVNRKSTIVLGTVSCNVLSGPNNVTNFKMDDQSFGGIDPSIRINDNTPLMGVNPNSFKFTTHGGNYYPSPSSGSGVTFSTVKVGNTSARTIYSEFEAQLTYDGGVSKYMRIISGYVTFVGVGGSLYLGTFSTKYQQDFNYNLTSMIPTPTFSNIGEIYVVSATAGSFTLGATISGSLTSVTTSIIQRTQICFTTI